MIKPEGSTSEGRIVVRDRRKGFLWIPNEVFDRFARSLNPSAFMVYMALSRRANNESQRAVFDSQAALAETVNLSERTVRTCLLELREVGLVEWELRNEAKGHYNVYTLTEPEGAANSTVPGGVRQPAAVDAGSGLPPTPEVGCRPNKEDKTQYKTHNKTHSLESDPEKLVAEIAKLHPRLAHQTRGPSRFIQEAIIEAVIRDGRDLVLARTKNLADAVATWPPHERRFAPEPVRFYREQHYLQDPIIWQRGSSVSDADFKRRHGIQC